MRMPLDFRIYRGFACAALLFLATGCAQQQQATSNKDGLQIIHDPDHRISASQWEVIELAGEGPVLAAVSDSTRNVLLSLACDDKSTVLLMGPAEKSTQLKDPTLELVWDGSITTNDQLESFSSEDGWGFGLDSRAPGFTGAVSRLKQHKTLAATVSSGGAEPLRYRFSLAQADKAMDYILANCKSAN